jgi:ABC-2 type transport system permease protein
MAMRRWLRSYLLLMRWNTIRLKYTLPLMLIVQTMLAIGIVIGFSFLMPSIDGGTALYLSTGAPTLGLITVGMVLAPQLVAQAKTEGTFDYNRTLPVPRTAILAADLTTWLATSLPGLILALLTATLRFDLNLTVSPLVIPAILLVAVTATAIGYAIAYAAPPTVTNLASQTIVFIALMFSPINFPADRLPTWLQTTQQGLPFQYMADAVRNTLTTPAGGVSAIPFAVLIAWCTVSSAITLQIMSRRT